MTTTLTTLKQVRTEQDAMDALAFCREAYGPKGDWPTGFSLEIAEETDGWEVRAAAESQEANSFALDVAADLFFYLNK